MVSTWFLDHLQPFLVQPFFDQVSNKGFALLAAGQFVTRLQEFGLRGSYLDGSWQAMPSITTFLTDYPITKFSIPLMGALFALPMMWSARVKVNAMSGWTSLAVWIKVGMSETIF
jgi:hypothetical protein